MFHSTEGREKITYLFALVKRMVIFIAVSAFVKCCDYSESLFNKICKYHDGIRDYNLISTLAEYFIKSDKDYCNGKVLYGGKSIIVGTAKRRAFIRLQRKFNEKFRKYVYARSKYVLKYLIYIKVISF